MRQASATEAEAPELAVVPLSEKGCGGVPSGVSSQEDCLMDSTLPAARCRLVTGGSPNGFDSRGGVDGLPVDILLPGVIPAPLLLPMRYAAEADSWASAVG